MVVVRGESMDVSDLSRISGIKYRTLIQRLNMGWSHDRLLEPAVRGKNQSSNR